MAARETLSLDDLRLLEDVIDPRHHNAPDEPTLFPTAVLCDLTTLVPCTQISFNWFDPYHGVDGGIEEFGEGAPMLASEEEVVAFFLEHFWASRNSDEERHGPQPVRSSGDEAGLDPRSRALSHEFNRLVNTRYQVAPALGRTGTVTSRLIFSRDDGIDFSPRELTILTLLRPHLHALQVVRERHRRPAPEVTARQGELLRLLATGLTNRQIARHLRISEGTVRKHLENVYAVLGVTHRMAAVETAIRYGIVTPR